MILSSISDIPNGPVLLLSLSFDINYNFRTHLCLHMMFSFFLLVFCLTEIFCPLVAERLNESFWGAERKSSSFFKDDSIS